MNPIFRWIATATLLACATVAPAAPRDGLVVSLSAPAPVLRGNVDVLVTVNVTNTTRAAIPVLRWELPSDRAMNVPLRITRDGEPVAYTGALAKRAAPTKDDYVLIDAGATLTYTVELTGSFDLTRNGTYAIEYAGRAAPAGDATLRSQPLYLWLESRTAAPAPAQVVSTTPPAATITYTGNCSASRQTALQQAMAAASVYADDSVAYFSTFRGATQRYVTWFGQPTRQRFKQIVPPHYRAIQDALANKPVTLDCSCNDNGVYAYVFPTQPYKIYLCGAFWAAPMTGTDSKAGTLIHEMSHFTVVADTDDFVYGQTGARALAISNPNQAVFNADSHEYFAENTPAQP